MIDARPTVLVTAGTGTVGRHVVGELARADVTVRVGSRDPERARERFADDDWRDDQRDDESEAERGDGERASDECDDIASTESGRTATSTDVPEAPAAFDDFPPLPTDASVEFVAFDYERPETWGPALADVDRLFLVFVPSVGADRLRSFVDAASRVGADHVAYLSTLGADRNPLIPHFWNERHLRDTPVAHTVLRASFFCQNLHEVHGRAIRDDGEIPVPAGDGETSFVDARDVAAVAARVLSEGSHRGRALDVTGPTAVDYQTVAQTLSSVLRRPITYTDPSVPAFLWRARSEHGRGFALLMVGIYTTARLGLASRVSDDAREVLGREPREFRAYAVDYAAAFGVEHADGPGASGPAGSNSTTPRR